MKTLGVSAFYHDSAACLVEDGQLLFAAHEERYSRKKHDASFPSLAISKALEYTGTEASQIDYVAFYEKPLLKFERLLETALAFAPEGFQSFSAAMQTWLGGKLFQRKDIVRALQSLDPGVDWSSRLLFTEHHLAHAASAFIPSPFETSAILTLDGVGEWATTSFALGREDHVSIQRELHFPHSLGMLYSAFTYYTGFKVNSGEYKLMGLAPYGEPRFAQDILDNLVDLKADGTFRLNMDYFNFATGLTMTSERFHDLFGGAPRESESPLNQRHMDLAASIQSVTEDVVLRLAKGISRESGQRNLCLAGGVALNCVANGKLLKSGIFENIWIQPAAGDAGGSLGAAMYVDQQLNKKKIRTSSSDLMNGALLGNQYSDEEIKEILDGLGAVYEVMDSAELIEKVAADLSSGKAVGWHQGRMEFGPRSLGARSILASPMPTDMQKNLNLKIKFRESFRPFAPSVLAEEAANWFDLNVASPYMLLVANVSSDKLLADNQPSDQAFGIDLLNQVRSVIPAVTHVDGSARIQTVHKSSNQRYHMLLSSFFRRTGCPVLVNTSFNVRGEPIVESPSDAYRCFMGTELDVLAIGNIYLQKSWQPHELLESYIGKYDLD